MKEYKITIELDNGAIFNINTKCFPHQIKETVEYFAWACFYEPTAKDATEITEMAYKAVA
jgi:hypothetical protein